MSHKWSRTSALPLTEYDLDTMDLVELKRRVGDLEKEVAEIDLENELFERYLEKHDPELLVGINRLMARQKTVTRIQFALNAKRSHDTTHSTGGYSRRASRQSSLFDSASIGTATSFARSARTLDSQRQEMRVGYAMRIELCNKEAATVRAETDRVQAVTKSQCRQFIAEVEELRLTNDEVIESRQEFHQFVLVNGMNRLTKRVPSERFLKYFDTWTKHGNAMVENIHMRTATLKLNSRQMKLALAIKAELSGILRPIDFEQLEIEKDKFQKMIDVKTVHLLALKRTTGNGSLALAMQRQQLLTKEDELQRLHAEKERVHKLTLKYEASSDNADRQILRWNRRSEKLAQQMLTYEAPTIFDYMRRKQELLDFQRDVKALQRSHNITVIKLKNEKIKHSKRLAIAAAMAIN